VPFAPIDSFAPSQPSVFVPTVSAPFTAWASTIPAEAIGSRPPRSRARARSASWIRSVTPVLSAGLDAGRTTWLLEIVRDCLQPGELNDEMAAELTRLARSDWLTVRAIAGRILDVHGRPVPDTPASTVQFARQQAAEGLRVSDREHEDQAEGLVGLFIDERLADANKPPGLREAIIDRVAAHIDDLAKRAGAQVDHLRSPNSRRIPDAYFADEEVIENEFQISAAGIRTARALGGALTEPRRFEYSLAQRLGPTGLWALRSEASRVPRPPTRAGALGWSLAPIPWVDNEGEWPPAGAVALADVRQLTRTDSQVVRVHEAPYEEWDQVALVECQATFASTYPAVPAREVLIAAGLEVCDGPPPEDSMPLSSSPPNPWIQRYNHLAAGLDADRAARILRTAHGPLAALIEYEGQPGAPARGRGAGLQPFALVPRIEVVALLGIRPEAPALRSVMIDDHGPALVCRQWRGFLIHDGSDGQMEPAIHGADLLLRPDLSQQPPDTTESPSESPPGTTKTTSPATKTSPSYRQHTAPAIRSRSPRRSRRATRVRQCGRGPPRMP